jgi:hypothetical protein
LPLFTLWLLPIEHSDDAFVPLLQLISQLLCIVVSVYIDKQWNLYMLEYAQIEHVSGIGTGAVVDSFPQRRPWKHIAVACIIVSSTIARVYEWGQRCDSMWALREIVCLLWLLTP